MSNEIKKSTLAVLDNDIYATKKELNEEARVRAESDQTIIDDFMILRKTSNNKFEEINKKIKEIDPVATGEKISQNANNIAKLQAEVTNNADHIVKIEKDIADTNNEVGLKQNIVDSTLETKNNTIPKAINELNTNLNSQMTNISKIQIEVTNNADHIAKIEKDIADTNNEVGLKQNIIDSSLETKNNTVPKAINELNTNLNSQMTNISKMQTELTAAEGNIKNNQDRIDNIEGCFFNRIKELETENEKLNEKISEANRTIIEKNGVIVAKDAEIEKLRDEISINGDEKRINLGFVTPPEFTLNKVMNVKNFINNYLKEVIIERMAIRYPGAKWGTDYTILLNGLAYNDVMQGKNVPVTIYALPEGNLTGESKFEILVTHEYDASQQTKFIEEFLQSAIPLSLRNIPENASPNYNVQKEIIETKPLKLLLDNQEFKQLTFKIFGEMNAASYWSDFQRSWQFINSNYAGTGQSTIGGTKIINGATDLYNNTVGYHNKIYQLIEQRINDSGVPCKVTKKWARHSAGSSMIHTLGNLIFNVTNVNLDDDETFVTQNRHYYMMINFDLTLNDQTKKFYRGVTLDLTDNLELY